MNKLFKFRAFVKETKKFIYFDFDSIQNIDPEILRCEIMQSIDMYDSEKKEIFEGDIICHPSYPLSKIVYCNERGGYCAEMLFDEKREGWDEADLVKTGNHIEPFYMDFHKCQVVGNIYDNLELLLKEKTN